MTLVNSLLALGTLAFAIPLAIHLLYRSRFVTVDWGAMHLLAGVMQVNRRRLQWTHWLLLFLRCLIPVLLALCLARPVLTGFRALAGDAPQSWVLVIDDSRSMAARGASGQPRIERVKQQLISTLGSLSRHDEVFVIPASTAGQPAGAMGPQAAIDAVRAIDAQTGPAELVSLLDVAFETADGASHPHRQIVLVSDFQSHLVDDGVFDSLGRLAAESQRREPPPAVSFWNVGGDSDELKNVSVESLRVESPAVIAGRPAEYAARVRNSSDTAATGVRVQWSIDGEPLDPQVVTLPARSGRTVRLRRAITEPGMHEVALAVEVDDALPEDNRRRSAVDVIREVGVLLVDGAPSARPLASETDFLAIALSPFALGQHAQRSDAVHTRSAAPVDAADQLSSQPWDVVVLANVPVVDAELEQALVRFVHRGGALVVFDGELVNPDDYNRRWGSGELAMNLPARLGPRIGDPAERDESAMQVGGIASSFPAWSMLADDDQRPLASVEVFAYRKLEPLGEQASRPDRAGGGEAAEGGEPAVLRGRAASPAPSVPVRMAGGDPLVVSARRGLGQVIQFAIPCDTAWSTLPLRPVFLPMMQQLVLHLAGSKTAVTSMTGEPLVIPLSEFEEASGTGGSNEVAGNAPRPDAYRYSVQPPTGGPRRLEPTRDRPARLIDPETTVPGVYRVRRTVGAEGDGGSDGERGDERGGQSVSLIRVVEVPATESQLRDVDPARLAAVADGLGAAVYPDAASFRAGDHERRFGREVWRWLLAALLAVMVAEVGLQQYAVRRSRVGVRG